MEEHCTQVLEQFLLSYIPNQLTKVSQSLITLQEKPPALIGSTDYPTQINIFMKTSSVSPIDLTTNTDEDISTFTSPPHSARSTYLAAASKAAKKLNSPAATTTTQNTNNTPLTISDSQYNQLSSCIDELLEINAQKNATAISDQQERDAKSKAFNDKLQAYASQMDEVNQKLNNTMDQMVKVVASNNSLDAQVKASHKRMDKMLERMDLMFKFFPEDIQNNIQNSTQNSTQAMETDGHQE